MAGDQEKWDRIYRSDKHGSINAAAVLARNAHLLPAGGKSLDLACGRGGNALFLAERGLDSHAWDISQVALDELARQADKLGLELTLEQRDVSTRPPASQSCDVIVVSRFLDRQLVPQLSDALKKDGLLFYQTFIRDAIDARGPSNPDYRLDNNELLYLFGNLRILYYHEEGSIGDTAQGFRNEAMLVAVKTETESGSSDPSGTLPGSKY